jgi:hypothetical protein
MQNVQVRMEFLEPELPPVNATQILDLAVIPGLPDDHPDHFKWAVILLWQFGRLQSFEAIFWLQIGQHISAYEQYTDADVYMRAYVLRERRKYASDTRDALDVVVAV